MCQWINYKGLVVYNPNRPNLKKIRLANQWFLFVEVCYDFAAFYRWLIFKRYGLRLNATAWKPHITVLDGRKEVKPEFRHNWKKYEKVKVEFNYSVNVQQHWKFWTLPVYSPKIIEIRKELGFFDNYPLHITIGRMD